ncbi:alpha-N-arabinofuranosidase [Echinicola strongylocentroti]|uniref:Alpha-N-arabinofuranosidase n=1 Tax=Echinicola strongylocentroti TaxID=1795355 RepID=A0A2Z4IQQ7_9BACT|nr:family 43 glycosylhydrolase [Echinicola strongylocentroti]AWW32896.1 alpha-N-arabinofuranosidase [Echinicola strongylocentroti]
MPKITNLKSYLLLPLLFTIWAGTALAQNPLVRDQFTADPSAMVVGDRVYVYPSHDIYCAENNGRENWFCMQDYHVFSSENLTEWTDHGAILHQEDVPWGNPTANSMWAPDCIERNGKYYFYFPDHGKDSSINGKGFTIGVAVADHPEGPFVPEPQPIKGVKGIDPNVFIDDDGQAYLYWSQEHIYGAKLKGNMLELAGDPVILKELPSEGLKEGPYMFKKDGAYYLTYPHVANKTERLEYAVGKSPLGPFDFKGVIMDESPTGCWTNHHSIIQFKGQHYLFYHHNDYSPGFDKNRSIRADSLFFENDESIRKVVPTLRGIGLTQMTDHIQMDRHSALGEQGASIAFLDPSQPFMGWKVTLAGGAWVKYNRVEFHQGVQTVRLRIQAKDAGKLALRSGKEDGQVMAEIGYSESEDWTVVQGKVKGNPSGIHDLVLVNENGKRVAVDWINFE